MKPHMQRVWNEREALDDKREALDAFLGSDIFKGLDPAEQGRLRRQLSVMTTYSLILTARLDAAR